MTLNQYEYTILGGDLRQVYMANELIANGYTVIVYGLNDPLLDSSCCIADSLAEAINSSNILITPIPISKDRINILTKVMGLTDLTINELCNYLSAKHTLIGGCLTKDLITYCENHSISYYDLMEQEEIVLYNAIATAEGAIAEAIINSTTNLHKSNCLVLGFGRCARTLAEKLKGLCSNVDIAARSKDALSAADASSFGTLPLTDLKDKIGEYDYVFNTIPALIVTKEILCNSKPDVVIIDIASAPGGVEYSYARELKRNAKLCLGLPGKYAPKSSATFLVNHLLHYIGKK